MQATANQILHHLKHRARRVVLVAHRNPDGDTLGTVTALAHFLKNFSVEVDLWCAHPASAHFSFLPRITEFHCDPRHWQEKQYDTIIACDAADLKMAVIEEPLTLLRSTPTIINFDHHFTNTSFGHFNFVQNKAASATEVLYNFFALIQQPIDNVLATCLLTGLLTDTAHFSLPNTTAETLRIGATLLRAGADYPTIINCTWQNKTFDSLKLWGLALSRLVIKSELGLAYTAITLADLQALGAVEKDLEGLSNLLNTVAGVDISLVLRETPEGTVRGSLRTTSDDIDVALLAQAFGGGGHQKAAGFTQNGRLMERAGEWLIVSD